MFRKIDLYIARKFISTFLFTIVMISMVSVAINFFENVDKLIADHVSMRQVVFDYYMNFIPWINGLLWPLFVFLSVIFFTSRMASNSEIISILCAGVSYRRFLLPFLVTSSIIAGIHWVGKNYIIPRSTEIKGRFEAEYIRRSQKKILSDNVHLFLSPNEKIYIRYFRTMDSSAQLVNIETFDEGKLSHLLKIRKLKWKEAPDVWTMHDYEHHYIDGLNETLTLYKEPKDTTIAITPDDFHRYTNQMEMLTTDELREFIEAEERRGIDTAKSFRAELYNRTSDSFTIIILTLLGAIIASRKTRGGLGLNLAFGVVLGASYVIMTKFSMVFATNLNFPPGLAAWTPNLVFVLITLLLYTRAQK